VYAGRSVLGTTIGSYRVRSKIGEGGMGSVYLAEHASLGRRVAVKVLLPEMSHDRSIVTRFFNEARAASQIRHPSIVEIHDFGYTPEGNAYIVMEHLDGETLASRCRRTGRLDVQRALLLTRQIAGGLAAAHDLHIVHRDLKPENIYLVSDPEVIGGERIKLLDFGIAKLLRDSNDASRTRTGSVLGTPAYMAPEQCRGSGTVDARADLYALGCVLYEMLLGRPPFTADGSGDLIAHHLYFEPTPPRQLDPELPDAIERFVLWLLRKDPAHRPQTAQELIATIDRLGTGTGDALPRPLTAPGPTRAVPAPTTLSGATGVSMRSASGTSRRRWVVPLVATLTAAAGVAAYLAFTHSHDGGDGDAKPAAPAPVTVVATPAPTPPQPAPPPPPVTPPPPAAVAIHLTVDSDPSGATVLRAGKVVGTTPFVDTLAPGSNEHEPRSYVVRKDGYEPATATLAVDRDASDKVVLKKKKPHPRVDTPAQPGLGDRGVNPFDQ
jgi:serine/threonine-protein kinase